MHLCTTHCTANALKRVVLLAKRLLVSRGQARQREYYEQHLHATFPPDEYLYKTMLIGDLERNENGPKGPDAHTGMHQDIVTGMFDTVAWHT